MGIKVVSESHQNYQNGTVMNQLVDIEKEGEYRVTIF
jgi:hypothetical protein